MVQNRKSAIVFFKNTISILLLSVLTTSAIKAQEAEKKKDDKPVVNAFFSGIFMENQTYLMNSAKAIEMVINHRFGKLMDGSKMAWGIYSPSNIRMGINYSINNKLQIGIGTTKYNKQQDGNIKYNLIQQTKSGKIPVSVTYYGNLVYDGRESASFNNPGFKESHRLSYFHEIMIARKFCDQFSLQVAPMFTYYNLVETSKANVLSTDADTLADPIRKHGNFGLSILGRASITSSLSFLFEYDHNFTKLIKQTDTYKNPKPNVSLGIEKATAAHSFQLFVTTAEALTYQRNMVYNQNDFIGKGDADYYFKSGLMIGFNITRIF